MNNKRFKINKKAGFLTTLGIFTAASFCMSLQEANAENAINATIKQNMSQGKWKSPAEQNWLGKIRHKYPYNNGVGKPTKVIEHETANQTSVITGEINYMWNNQDSAFVHEFVDANNIIGIADTDYLAWGAGPYGNGTGIQVEQVRMHSKDDFAKEIMNLATFNVSMMKQYKLAPTMGQSNGAGTIWTHAMVTRYLGGTDHMDPDQYWADSARQWFGTTYTINDFHALVNDMYNGNIKPSQPANVNATTKVRQEGGNFIADVTVSGDTSRITEVQVPTWSATNGQKDLKWYTAQKINANTYRATIPVSNHKKTGDYIMHTYVRANDGTFKSKASNTIKYQEANVSAKTEHLIVNGKLLVRTTLSGDTNRVSQVEVPIWRNSNQSDLKWNKMVKKSDKVYEYVYDGLKGSEYGFINTHVYVMTDGFNNKNKTVNGFTFAKPDIKGTTTAQIQGNNVKLTSKLSGELNRIDYVQFPTWQNGKNNTKWYKGTKINDSEYTCTIPLKDYNNEKGAYTIHSYVKTTEGKDQSYASTGFVVKEPEVKSTTKADVKGNVVNLTTTLTGDTDYVSQVQHPTWSQNNASNKIWHNAKKINNTTYVSTVSLDQYKQYGKYTTHTYTTVNGKLICTDKFDFNFNAPNVTQKTTVTMNNDIATIRAELTGDYEQVTKVEFPTWTDGKGNTIWHQGTKVANNIWESKVDMKKNYVSGNQTIHTYVTTNNFDRKGYFGASFNWEDQTNIKITAKESKTNDTLWIVNGNGSDKNMYQGNPPLTDNGGKSVGQIISRNNQTFRSLRTTILSNGKIYEYGLFGDGQYYWIENTNLKDQIATPTIVSDNSLYDSKKPESKQFGEILTNVTDIRKGDPRYRVQSDYKNATDIQNSNSAKSLSVQLTRKTVYNNGETWYEFTQSNKNGISMGWVNAKYLK